MRELFYEIADYAFGQLAKDEVLILTFEGEESDFVRLNHNQVRQAGAVRSCELGLDLIRGQRHAEYALTLSGEQGADRELVAATVGSLRDRLGHLPEDPHLLYATEVRSTERAGEGTLPERAEALETIQKTGTGKDLVGIYAQGPIYRGFANSLGQRNWFSTKSFHLDWSFYLRDDKAVKSSFAGFEWDPAKLQQKMAEA
jgi:predicted Zn-dependent protease